MEPDTCYTRPNARPLAPPARSSSRKPGGEIVVVAAATGQIREVDTYTVGEDGFDKINAVEGIFLGDDVSEDFRTLDRK